MPRGPGVAVLLALTASVASADEDENWQRLRAMPREQRVILADKIREFDLLPPDEKTAIRNLDGKIEKLSAADQASYRSVLRRYHLWLQSLPEAKRKLVESTPPDQRMAVVARLRAEEGPANSSAEPLEIRHADLRGPSIIQIARLLKTWIELTDAERDDIEKQASSDRVARLTEIANSRKTRLPSHAHMDERTVDETLKKLEANPKLKGWNFGQLKLPGLDKATEKEKTKAKTKVAHNRRRLAENYAAYLHPPKSVDPENLFRFETALPGWVRPAFDLFPPDVARRRLTILYRLIYPHPNEMPKRTAKPSPKTVKPPANPKPAAKTAPPL